MEHYPKIWVTQIELLLKNPNFITVRKHNQMISLVQKCKLKRKWVVLCSLYTKEWKIGWDMPDFSYLYPPPEVFSYQGIGSPHNLISNLLFFLLVTNRKIGTLINYIVYIPWKSLWNAIEYFLVLVKNGGHKF